MISAENKSRFATKLRTRSAQYLMAVLVVASASSLRFFLGRSLGFSKPHIVSFPFVFFPAIIFVTYWGGLGPGIMACTLSTAVTACFFLPQLNSLVSHAQAVVGLGMSFVVGVIVAGLADLSRRRKAELQDREERYRDLVENSEDLLCTHDLGGKLLSVNPAPARVLGYEVAELLQIPLRQLIAPGYQEEFDKYLIRIAETGADSGLLAVLTRTGQRRVWEYRNTLRVRQGAAPIVRGMAHDVTDRLQAEKSLRVSEENYRRFVNASSEGIFRYDMDEPVSIDSSEDELVRHILHDSYVAECNPAFAAMYGLSSAESFLGKRLTDTANPQDIKNIELILEYVRSGFCAFERQSQEVDVNGNPKIFLNSMTGIVERGKLLRTWGIKRDITERVKLEQARLEAEELLRSSEERFRVALRDSPVTVFQQDTDLRYKWIYNPHSYFEGDILGKTDEDVLGPEASDTLIRAKREVLATCVGARLETAVLFKGKKQYFDLALEPSVDSSGRAIGITGAAMDIAKLHELTEFLEEERDKLSQEKVYLQEEISSELGFEKVIGQSKALKKALRLARMVAVSDATVLLLGETGTGKELVARSIHQLSARQNKNFIKLNCAALPSGLLESELFGYEKGAFTHATAQKRGRIELAHEGTIFLDEIGELPLELQPKLLRVLQDQEFERLGGTRTLKVNTRIIAATNRNLLREVAEKRFREDLYYRLHVFPIRLPLLRERRSDIPLLIAHFIRHHATRMNKRIEGVSSETMAVLHAHDWPGNIRELENLIERLTILAKGPILSLPLQELENFLGRATPHSSSVM